MSFSERKLKRKKLMQEKFKLDLKSKKQCLPLYDYIFVFSCILKVQSYLLKIAIKSSINFLTLAFKPLLYAY